MRFVNRTIDVLGVGWRELIRDKVYIAPCSLINKKLPRWTCQQRRFLPFEAKMSTVAATTSRQQSSLNHFEDIFPTLVNDVTQSSRLADAPDITQWLEKVLQYNCTGGKKNRGMATVASYEMLESPQNVTSESLRLAGIMGWCVELLQAYLLMLDDVMDGSEYRRGELCWYRHHHVGLSAVNDALLVQGTLHTILRKYFRDQPYYTDVLDTFNEVLFHTSMGQYLDWSTAHGERVDLSTFTMDRYSSIIKYKTAYYTFLLPTKLAMYMAGKRAPEAHGQVDRICLKIGHFFQIQDDYLDCFGTREEIGKDGTDIKEGKCCWPAVVALQRCSPEQRLIMETYYGSKDPAHELIIKDLYQQLGIRELYLAQEKQGYEDIRADIRQLSPDLSQELFVKLLDKIYKRKS